MSEHKAIATDIEAPGSLVLVSYSSGLGEVTAFIITVETLESMLKQAREARKMGGWISASAQAEDDKEILAICIAPTPTKEVPRAILSEIAKRYLPENLPQ